MELRRLQRQLGIIFVHVTHSQDEAMALADLIVIMNNGRIEQAGTPRQLFNEPKTEFVAKFIGGHNVIPTDLGTIAVRADRLVLRRPAAGVNASIEGVVRSVEYQGTYVQLALDAEGGREITAMLDEATFDQLPFSPGDSVAVSWGENDIHHLNAA
jgi:putative spermidine/putrescine transport system ATP-binding protein